MNEVAAEFAYLVAAVLFIIGLKRLSSPATARSGNQAASLGMGDRRCRDSLGPVDSLLRNHHRRLGGRQRRRRRPGSTRRNDGHATTGGCLQRFWRWGVRLRGSGRIPAGRRGRHRDRGDHRGIDGDRRHHPVREFCCVWQVAGTDFRRPDRLCRPAGGGRSSRRGRRSPWPSSWSWPMPPPRRSGSLRSSPSSSASRGSCPSAEPTCPSSSPSSTLFRGSPPPPPVS